MERSRMSVLAGGSMLVFVDPRFLDELVDSGRGCSRAGYIGTDRDHELEALESAEETFGGHDDPEVALPHQHESTADCPDDDGRALDNFAFAGFVSGDAGRYDDDPHEDLLQRIGALSRGRR